MKGRRIYSMSRAEIAGLERRHQDQALEERRCRRLCCPAAAPHDRTHPLCVVRPVLWQDDGDQA